jgi:RHS repeat-associated protein
MLMPERSGYKTAGGWASGNEQVNGNTVPQTLTVDERHMNTPSEYKASHWIEITDGFTSGTTDEFVAYIADGSNTTAGNPGGSGGENNTYRYGFNGKENDDEVKGVGNELNYGARIYDTRIGRFLSLDPEQTKYATFTPYQYTKNNPIAYVDIEGKYSLFIHYMLTRYMLMKAGVPEVQANLIAHYGSVYVDNPGGVRNSNEWHIHDKGDIIIGVNITKSQENNPIFKEIGGKLSEKHMLFALAYRNDVNYSRTQNSQGESEESQKWHATRTYEEKDRVSAADAVNRSFANAWMLLFKSANQESIEKMQVNSAAMEDLGIALHTFQDIEAHRGAVFRGIWKNGGGLFKWFGNKHSMQNDNSPELSRFKLAQFYTGNAILVHQILSGNYQSLKNGIQISTQGMSNDQINKLREKLQGAGYNFTSNGPKTYMYTAKKK